MTDTFWEWVEAELQRCDGTARSAVPEQRHERSELGGSWQQILAEQRHEPTPAQRAGQITLEAEARRRLCSLLLERAVADVCPSCGLHMVADVTARVALLERGGVARCPQCRIDKRVEAGPVAVASPVVAEPAAAPTNASRKAALPGGAYGGGKRAPGGEIAMLGRFKVLQRTDGRYVVHETEQQGVAPFRFGPVFDDLNLAKWRVWWRLEGEKKTGLRIGQDVLCEGLRVELLDFVAEGRAFVKLPTGMPQEARIGYLQQAPPLPPPLPLVPYVEPERRAMAPAIQGSFDDERFDDEEIPF
jgi:hypothetical protein